MTPGDETLFDVNTYQNIADAANDLRLCKKIIDIDTVAHKITFDGEFDVAAGARMGMLPYNVMVGSSAGFYPTSEYGSTSVPNTMWYLTASVAKDAGTNRMERMKFLVESYGLCERYANGHLVDPTTAALIYDFPYGIMSPNILVAPDDGYLNNEDVFGISQRDSGTATSGAVGSLTDTAKAWGVNEHIDRYCVITLGTGAGQVRRITSNTVDTLTPATNWNVAPDATSEYVIVDAAYRYFKVYNEFAVKIGG